MAPAGTCRRGSTSAPVGSATIVLLATDWPADLARALAGIRRWSPADTSVVVVADGPSDEQAADLDALETSTDDLPLEVVWTSERLGHGAALNVGLRRASGSDRDPARYERGADR